MKKKINRCIKSYNITTSQNIKYVYFKIEGLKLSDIIPSVVTIFISNFDKTNQLVEDKLNHLIIDNSVKNNINNVIYNDIKYSTENNNNIIFRTPNIQNTGFVIVYVINT